MSNRGASPPRTAACAAVAVALLLLPVLGLAQPSRHFRFRFAEDFQGITLDGRTRAKLANAAQPSKGEACLGLELRDGKTEQGCLVRGVRPGPIRDLIQEADRVLSLNGIETDTSEQFRQAFAPVKPGEDRRIVTIEYRQPPQIATYPLSKGDAVRRPFPSDHRGLWLSPDGKRMATMHMEQIIQVWALENLLPPVAGRNK